MTQFVADAGPRFGEGGDGMLFWGPPAAAMIETGLQRLIARLDAELGTYPSAAEIHDHIYGPNPAPELTDAIIYAANVFRLDVGRYPSPAEVATGLQFIDTETALLTYIANDIRVGDRVMWAEHDENGECVRQFREGSDDTLVFVYGTVTGQPEGWSGNNRILRDDGRPVSIGREWLVKVPK